MTREMSAEPVDLLPLPVGVGIARQAIHDRWTRVTGYALLLRGHDDGSDAHDEEQAATRVIVETFTAIGVQAVAGGRPAYVRVPRRFLLEDHVFALPPARVVLELLDPDPSDVPLRQVLERLVEQRYRISLTCSPQTPVPYGLMPLVESVKLNVAGLSPMQIDDTAQRFRAATATLIAAGVDTPALLEHCRAAGFDRFQGFFLCTPDVIEGAAPPTGRLTELRTLAGLYAHATFEQLEQTIVRDVGLSFRLLAYLNSAYFNLPRRVASIREAIMLLGTRAVQRWATLITLSGAKDQPHELTLTALVRARMCELVGAALPSASSDGDACFTVGLLSVMDAIANMPLAQALAALPLADESRAALLERRGPMGEALSAVLAYERNDLVTAGGHAPGLPLGDLYLSAIAWADDTSGMLRSTTRTMAATTSGAN